MNTGGSNPAATYRVGDVVVTYRDTLGCSGQLLLPCDGSTIASLEYPELFALVGNKTPTYSSPLPYKIVASSMENSDLTDTFTMSATATFSREVDCFIISNDSKSGKILGGKTQKTQEAIAKMHNEPSTGTFVVDSAFSAVGGFGHNVEAVS